jgi:iron complex outermembrane receptor protein
MFSEQYHTNTRRPGFRMAGPLLIAIFLLPILLIAREGYTEDKITLARLSDLSVNDLMDVKITTSKKTEESAFDSASSVYVISREAIKRSGAGNLPEALRLAPGLNVSRVDLNNYMVSGTVNNDYFTDKLLVLVDGRPIQSRTFSLVWWPAQMYPLEDIERIEVIRGAGSALWGSNAMGGVINIITRKASDSKGGYAQVGGGKIDREFGTVRYGASAGDNLSYRIYAMGGVEDGARFVSGERSAHPRDSGAQNNRMNGGQAGFKMDWDGGSSSASVHGDAYSVNAFTEGAMFVRPMLGTQHFLHEDKFEGYNLVGLYTTRYSEALSAKLQVIHEKSRVTRAMFAEEIVSLDAEGQADYNITRDQTVSVGANHTRYDDAFTGSSAVSKPSGPGYTQSVFAQDEIRFMAEKLRLILGAKAEKNIYADWRLQPNVKAAWLGGDWTVWGSAARSARLPNTMNNDTRWVVDSVNNYPNKGSETEGPGLLGIITDKGAPLPEEVDSYEAGVRLKPSQWLVVDASLFHNTYRNAISLFEDSSQAQQPGAWDPYNPYVYDIYYRNMYDGQAYGGTLSINAKPAFWAQLSAAYTYTRITMTLKDGVPPNRKHSYGDYLRGSTPLNSVKSALRLDLPWMIKLDLLGTYTDPMRALNVWNNIRLDIRLAYDLAERLEISLTGRNLLKERQMEWYSPWTYDNAWVQRDFVVKADYKF